MAKKSPPKKKMSPSNSKTTHLIEKTQVSSSLNLEIRLAGLELKLSSLETKLEVLSGVTREYLEEQFAKLNDFHIERKTLAKIIDQHESRINSLEGF